MEDEYHHTMVDSSDTNMDSSTMDSSAPSSVHGEESREQSISQEQSPPVQTAPSPPGHLPLGPLQLRRKASSRLPVPKKFYAPIPTPISVPPYGSLRPAPSKDLINSPGPKSASPRIPSVTKRQSRIGGLKSPVENARKYSFRDKFWYSCI